MLFFFQAEDGIRDIGVTGVQTCALPISGEGQLRAGRAHTPVQLPLEPRLGLQQRDGEGRVAGERRDRRQLRSEERRVGKECRSRRSPYHSKKNPRLLVRRTCLTITRTRL